MIPDGGMRAWLTVLGGQVPYCTQGADIDDAFSWISLFTTFGSASSFGVFEDLYVRAGASSASNISWIGSVQLCLMFSMGLVSGKLFDMGHFHSTQIVGILIYLVWYVNRIFSFWSIADYSNSLFMLSLTDFSQYYQLFLAQGLGVGIGFGLLFLPALAVQGHHWKKRRALVMGIVLTGAYNSNCPGFANLRLQRLCMRRSCLPHHDESLVHTYEHRVRLVCEDHGLHGYWPVVHRQIANVHKPASKS